MNYELMTRISLGELSIVLTMMLLSYSMYLIKKRNRPLVIETCQRRLIAYDSSD
jgi:hypothetical protein